MKFSKKNILTTGLAVTLAAGMVLGGGTFAYLQGTTDDVVNEFDTNKVLVDLDETTGENYNIIPGTEEEKDPTVTVDNTVDSYVYVEVTDTTDGLVTYEIAEGWTKLDGYDNVYYREVAADEEEKEFAVLKDNKVTYDAALENSDMLDENGKLKEGIELTFKAYAIQKAPFADAAAAYSGKDSSFVESADEFTAALASGKPIVLSADVTVGTSDVQNLADSVINLNGKTLTVNSAAKGIDVASGRSMTIENGTFNWNAGTSVAIALESGAEVTLKNVEFNTSATINVEQGADPAVLNIVDSTINSTDYYCVSTNAANNQSGKTVEINIVNSVLSTPEGKDENGDCTAVLFNVPGKLNITGSTLTAGRQAVIVRCGEAVITNSTLNCTVTCPSDWIAKYDNTNWSSGNEVPVAVLVVGNRSGATSYPHDATCTLTNATLNIPDESGRSVIYAAAYNGHTTTIDSGGVYDASVSVVSDDESSIIIR